MELRTAIQACVPIRPVIRVEDKLRIGALLSPLKKAALADLGIVGQQECLDFNRNDMRKFVTDTDILLEDMPKFVAGWPVQLEAWRDAHEQERPSTITENHKLRVLCISSLWEAGARGLHGSVRAEQAALQDVCSSESNIQRVERKQFDLKAWEDVKFRLVSQPCDVLIISGHGGRAATFEGQPADHDRAASDIIDSAAPGLRLVVLNTCRGWPLAMAIQRHCEDSTCAVDVVLWAPNTRGVVGSCAAEDSDVSTRLCQRMPALLLQALLRVSPIILCEAVETTNRDLSSFRLDMTHHLEMLTAATRGG